MTHLSVSTAAVALAVMLGLGAATPASAFGTEDYIGSVGLTGATFCPRNTMDADGRLLPIAEYQALFSLLGTTYGGDGRTTFGLPDLQKQAPVKGMRYCVVVQGIYPSRP